MGLFASPSQKCGRVGSTISFFAGEQYMKSQYTILYIGYMVLPPLYQHKTFQSFFHLQNNDYLMKTTFKEKC